jgi:bacterioferritin-associated ferredoxin
MDRAVNRLLRTTCILRLPAAIENHWQSPGPPFVYVCNCNGLRKRDVAAAIEAGATRPRDVFARNQCSAQCAKCVCEMREMIQETRQAFAMAAE